MAIFMQIVREREVVTHHGIYFATKRSSNIAYPCQVHSIIVTDASDLLLMKCMSLTN
jgi:hypothetical protein